MAKLLKSLGHTVLLYASEENEAPCDELIKVISKEEQKTLLDGLDYQYAALYNKGYPLWALANNRAIVEIGKRKQDRDFILTIGGTSQQPIADFHKDLMTVEYSIGYVSSFAKYRVYESHYWRAWTTGHQQSQDGRFFDDVIPLPFDDTEFRVVDKPNPYILYVGRLVPKKGLSIACDAAKKSNVQLKVIGHGDPSLITYGEYLGALPDEQRNEYMANASALICPTLYIEPFGSVAIEAQMCGTPVICPDWGGFVETVKHGITGFRCRYLGEFVKAIQNIGIIDRDYVHRRAVEKYSIKRVAKQYESYFNRLNLLWESGWDTV